MIAVVLYLIEVKVCAYEANITIQTFFFVIFNLKV